MSSVTFDSSVVLTSIGHQHIIPIHKIGRSGSRDREAVKKLPEPAVATNSPFGKGAAPKARGLARETGRPVEDDGVIRDPMR